MRGLPHKEIRYCDMTGGAEWKQHRHDIPPLRLASGANRFVEVAVDGKTIIGRRRLATWLAP